MSTIVLAADVKTWIDTNLAWGDQAVRRLILLAAVVGGIGLLIGTRGNFTRSIKYGGIAARVTAARHPGRVVGLLLVDSSHEQQARQLAQRDPKIPRSEIWRRAARRQMRSLGWYRAWHDLTGRRALLREAVDEVGEQLAPAVVARSLRTASRRAVVGEMVGIALAPYVTPDWARRLGDLPTTVLTVGDGHAWGPAYPTWFELHQSFLAMSTRGRHVVLDGTGHHMNHDVPHDVATAITDLVNKARHHGTRSASPR